MSLRGESGIVFVSVIFAVVMIGFMLAMTGQTWSKIMKREKEEELLFRGGQIFWAVSSWYAPRGGHPPVPLRDLKDLLKDPRYLAVTRHLRKVYQDPLSGEDFEPVRRTDGGIVGVRSKSKEKPIKQGNFDPWFKHFEGKEKYSDWLFVPSSQRRLLPTQQTGETGQSTGATPRSGGTGN